MMRKEGKEEILRLRDIGEHMRPQDLPFFSDMQEISGVLLLLEIGEMMRKEGKDEDRQQGSLASSIDNIRGFAFFQRDD